MKARTLIRPAQHRSRPPAGRKGVGQDRATAPAAHMCCPRDQRNRPANSAGRRLPAKSDDRHNDHAVPAVRPAIPCEVMTDKHGARESAPARCRRAEAASPSGASAQAGTRSLSSSSHPGPAAVSVLASVPITDAPVPRAKVPMSRSCLDTRSRSWNRRTQRCASRRSENSIRSLYWTTCLPGGTAGVGTGLPMHGTASECETIRWTIARLVLLNTLDLAASPKAHYQRCSRISTHPTQGNLMNDCKAQR